MSSKPSPDQVFCKGCGTVSTTKKMPMSDYRTKGACVHCGYELQPLAARGHLQVPGQIVQPMDKVITHIMRGLRNKGIRL